MKFCFVCNKKIELKRHNRKQRTCSDLCRKKLHRQKNKYPNEYLFVCFFFMGPKMKTTKLKNPKNAGLKKPKKIRNESKDFSFNCFLESICSHCGKSHVRLLFTARPKRPSKHILCWECSYRHRRACSYCKVEFSPVSLVGNSACYCIPCRRKLMTITKQKGTISGLYSVSECRWCLKMFRPSTNRSNCCSRHCSMSLNGMIRTTGKTERFSELMICKCGKLIGKRFHKCMDCVLKDRDAYQILARRRRYLAERVGDNGISWKSIGDRDGWICHLCGWLVRQNAGTAYVPDGATVDHVIPIARGGTHTWDNVALAHRSCNVSRGAKDLECSDNEQ